MLYEYKKILKNKIIIILLICVTVLPAIISMLYASNHANWVEKGEEVSSQYYHHKYEEGIFPEVESLSNQYLMDYSSPESIGYSAINSCLTTYETCLAYRKQMVNRINMMKGYTNAYTYKVNDYLLEQYSQPIEFYLYDNYYIETMIIDARNWTSVIPLLAICFIGISIFYADRENNTQLLVYSSKYGRTRTYMYKMVCLLSFTVLIMVMYNTMRLIPQFMYGDMVDFLQPIQSMKTFIESPYNINNITLILLMTLMQILVAYLFAIISVVLVNAFKKVIVPLCCIVLLCGASYFGYIYIYMKSIGSVEGVDIVAIEKLVMNSKKFTPLYHYFSPLVYFEKYMHVNMFGIPISYICFSVSIVCVMVVMLYIVGLLLYNYRFRRT